MDHFGGQPLVALEYWKLSSLKLNGFGSIATPPFRENNKLPEKAHTDKDVKRKKVSKSFLIFYSLIFDQTTHKDYSAVNTDNFFNSRIQDIKLFVFSISREQDKGVVSKSWEDSS